MKVKDLVCSNVLIKVGNGHSTSFWNDHQVGSSLLKNSFPKLFAITETKDASITNLWDSTNESSTINFRRLSKDDETKQLNLVGVSKYCTLTQLEICFTINELCHFLHVPTTTHLHVLSSILISWCSSKQNVVSHSSTKLEHRRMSNVTTELMWVQFIMFEIGRHNLPPHFCFVIILVLLFDCKPCDPQLNQTR